MWFRNTLDILANSIRAESYKNKGEETPGHKKLQDFLSPVSMSRKSPMAHQSCWLTLLWSTLVQLHLAYRWDAWNILSDNCRSHCCSNSWIAASLTLRGNDCCPTLQQLFLHTMTTSPSQKNTHVRLPTQQFNCRTVQNSRRLRQIITLMSATRSHTSSQRKARQIWAIEEAQGRISVPTYGLFPTISSLD